MSGAVFALATDVLIGDAMVRQGSRGNFTTATIRAGAGDDCQFIGLIAFQEAGERLARFHKGDAISVNRARSRSRAWRSLRWSSGSRRRFWSDHLGDDDGQAGPRLAVLVPGAHRRAAVDDDRGGRPFVDRIEL